MLLYHGLLGLEQGNNMYDVPPAMWFDTGTDWKVKSNPCGFNYNYNKWYLISTTTFMGHLDDSKEIF